MREVIDLIQLAQKTLNKSYLKQQCQQTNVSEVMLS